MRKEENFGQTKGRTQTPQCENLAIDIKASVYMNAISEVRLGNNIFCFTTL